MFNLSSARCKHHQAHPVCKVHVVFHDLQGGHQRCIEGGDGLLELVDSFCNPSKVSNDGIVQCDLAGMDSTKGGLHQHYCELTWR